MPKIAAIDPADIPQRGGKQETLARVYDAGEALRGALKGSMAIRLDLGAGERASAFIAAYKQAAKDLKIGVIIIGAHARSYASRSGKEHKENATLYIRVTRASVQVPSNGPAVPVREPITGALISR